MFRFGGGSDGDSVAQLVEQYTFNVWALGSSPSGITEQKEKEKQKEKNPEFFFLFFFLALFKRDLIPDLASWCFSLIGSTKKRKRPVPQNVITPT